MPEEDPEGKSEKKTEAQTGESAEGSASSAQGETAQAPEPEKAKEQVKDTGTPELEECPSLEPSAELKRALTEAVLSFEKAEEKKRRQAEEEKAQPALPTEQELKLKVEILELRHKVQDLEVELETKAKEIKQNYEQGMMLKNQFDAYKTRVMRERADWFNYGHEPLIKELLLVLDNFERALSHAQRPEDFESLKQGIEMIYRQLFKVLENFGVKPLQAIGQTFNPIYHEAMVQVINLEYPPGVVIEEHTKGYLLKDRLLRPSRVTISALPRVEEPDSGNQKPADQAVPAQTEFGDPAYPAGRAEPENKREVAEEVKINQEENPEKQGGENK